MNQEQQNWGYTVLQTKKGLSKLNSEQLAAKSISEGRSIETVKKGINNKNNVPSNLKQIIESENFSVDTVSFDLKTAIQRARQQKGMNQTELARAIMEKQTVIGDYESGRAIPNPAIINKLERALGVRLPRQKTKKDKKSNDEN